MADGVLIQAKGNPARTKMASERDAKILVRLGRWEYPTVALEAGPPPRAEPEIPDPGTQELEAEPASKPTKDKAAKAGRKRSGEKA